MFSHLNEIKILSNLISGLEHSILSFCFGATCSSLARKALVE